MPGWSAPASSSVQHIQLVALRREIFSFLGEPKLILFDHAHSFGQRLTTDAARTFWKSVRKHREVSKRRCWRRLLASVLAPIWVHRSIHPKGSMVVRSSTLKGAFHPATLTTILCAFFIIHVTIMALLVSHPSYCGSDSEGWVSLGTYTREHSELKSHA